MPERALVNVAQGFTLRLRQDAVADQGFDPLVRQLAQPVGQGRAHVDGAGEIVGFQQLHS